MGRIATHGLSKHQTKGYRISLGKKPEGGYRTFWLGKHRPTAEYHAEQVRARFDHMQDEGRDVWTDKDLGVVAWAVEQFKAMTAALRSPANIARLSMPFHAINAATVDPEVEKPVAIPAAPAPLAVSKKTDTTAGKQTLNLHGAIDAYVEAFNAKAVSPAHRERTRQLLDDLKHYRPDVPLAEIDRVWLQTLTDHIKSRPKSRVRRTPLAPLTVRNTLRTWLQFFDWLDLNADSPRFGGWTAPRRMDELFTVKLSKLMTKAERDAHADGPKHLTSDQVVRLYRAAKSDVHRIAILLGVFAALGQKEIATLRRDEFDLTKSLLTHRRSKTGQKGQFHLPPEATKLIKRYFKDVPTARLGVAFVTADGQPLVTETSDAVRQAWVDIVDRVNAETKQKILRVSQGFYSLRKFAADYAMRSGGPVLRDAMLAHAAVSVGDKHYSNTRDFKAVIELGKKLAAELRKLGMFESRVA